MTVPISKTRAVFVILLIGFIVRIWGVSQELPHHYYIDENGVIATSLKLGTGDLNPHYFIYPTFWYYTLFFFYGLYYLIGKLIGLFVTVEDYVFLYIKDPTSFFLIARWLSVLMGTAAVWGTYLLGKKLFTKEVGLVAAALLSVMPLHVLNSHYAIVDVPMVTIFIFALLSIVSVMKKGTAASYYVSGCLIGLSTATKYTAGIAIFPLFYAHWQALIGRVKVSLSNIFLSRLLWSSCLLAGLVFIAACPFSVLDYRKFIGDLVNQWQASKVGMYGWELQPETVKLFVTTILRKAVTAPLWYISVAGFLYACLRRKREDIFLLLPLIFYFLVMSNSKLIYDRYLLPMLPILAVFSGRLISAAAGWVRIRPHKVKSALMTTAAVLLMIAPLRESVAIDRALTRPSGPTIMKEWVEKNIPGGSRILLDSSKVPLVNSPESLRKLHREKYSSRKKYGYRKMTDLFFDLQIEASRQAPITYDLSTLVHPIGYLSDEGEFHQEWVTLEKAREMLRYKGKYDYIIITAYYRAHYLGEAARALPERFYYIREFYRSLEEDCVLMKEFSSGGKWQMRVYKVRR